MSKGVERYGNELRSIHTYVQALSHARTVEQVYAFGLNAVFEIFQPDRAFVALPESEMAEKEEPNALRSGWITNASVPIYAARKVVGKFMLQYNQARSFTEAEILLAELIALQAGTFIHSIQERQEKHALVAMAVHELRAPLTTIIGATYVLRTRHGEAAEHAIEMIDRNAHFQEKLIKDLLNISQIDAGKVELFLNPMDVVSALQTVIEDIRLTAGGGCPAIRLTAQGPLMIRADAQRLWQIFSNLLSNSIRYSSETGQIDISAVRDGTMIVVSIHDNGLGISADQLPFIFDRFRQAHVGRSQSSEGLGLGLAIVKELVTMHGGSISADSPGPGKGTNFVVRLPAVD